MRISVGSAAALAVASAAAVPAAHAQNVCYVQSASTQSLPAPRSEEIGERPVLRSIPLHPRGIIYLFHGTGGSERFAIRAQTARALAPFVAAGYGYVAAPSADRVSPIRWRVDDAGPASNADIAYMLALHKGLIAKGEIAANTPVFTMGMSNGGAFANLFAAVAKQQGLPVTAVADYMGPFQTAQRALVTDPRQYPPTLVVTAQNDGYVDTDRNTAFARQMIAGGAPIEIELAVEHPVCADTFRAIAGLSPADRETLVTKTLPGAGLIDATGKRTVFLQDRVITPQDMADVRHRLADVPQGREIAALLFVAWAAHEMRSDYAERQLKFFEAARAKPR